ncbi:hypothetical protein D0864_07897 [Hortaea werneckii]|uniref:Ketoreductase (KR) domain-containing protein n=1 Tax=Hortaea werneckii TaxID=91943 RepID=A0A3M7F315_HORWE|nr:hypothetical protein KC323_g7410 [Hortaea werneckii]KAI7351614.1 hypothetical protein KC320_g4845 [Hortaea werneckii]RMY83133.1 hypothetical protein D0864_07897 [Hortaea werneckii]RMY91040.1 hypothetical protein D0862_09829 [Hortaea werneckii]
MSGLWNLYQAKQNPPPDTEPSFSDRIILVTGSNTGVGFEAALKFVALGAQKVILGVRSIEKGEDAQAQIEERTGRLDVVDVWQLDMLDYESIKTFADRARSELERLDVAVLNAGAMFATAEYSIYGWEKTLQTNVVSTASLGLLLLPKLKDSKTDEYTPVLELVGSSLHRRFTQLEDPTDGQLLKYYSENFSRAQYGISKLFMEYVNIGLAKLARPDPAQSPDVLVISVSPGLCRSNLGRAYMRWYLWPAMIVFTHVFQRTAEEGARMYISGTQVGEEGHGRFWHEGAVAEPAPLLEGERGAQLQKQVWQEVMKTLEDDIQEPSIIGTRS